MSTLTIELDSHTEHLLQEFSLLQGRKREEIVANLLSKSLIAPLANGKSEATLLAMINQSWNEQEWRRYHELTDLRKEELISEEQYEELCVLTNEREFVHANRLRLVFQLAKVRNCTFEETMAQLGIGTNRVELAKNS